MKSRKPSIPYMDGCFHNDSDYYDRLYRLYRQER